MKRTPRSQEAFLPVPWDRRPHTSGCRFPFLLSLSSVVVLAEIVTVDAARVKMFKDRYASDQTRPLPDDPTCEVREQTRRMAEHPKPMSRSTDRDALRGYRTRINPPGPGLCSSFREDLF
jgi:hypothetical protein